MGLTSGIFDVRPGERWRTFLLVLSILAIVAAYMMVKAVRDAVFLSKFGATELAFLFIILAVTAGVLSAVGTRVGQKHSIHVRILATHAVVAASLLVIWIALRKHVPGTAWVLYVWSAFFGLFVIANFWLLANQLYDARAAKRIFPLLGAGAILGGVVGGQATSLALVVGAVDLLPIISGGFVLSSLLAAGAWRLRQRPAPQADLERIPEPRTDPRASEQPGPQETTREGFSLSARTDSGPAHPTLGEGFRLVSDNRYLRLIAGLLLLATLATTLVDLQLKAVVKEHFGSHRDEMAAFFGQLTKIFSLVSLLVQVFVTSRFLKRFGVRTALLILPVALALGAGAVTFHVFLAIPLVTAAALAKIGDGGLRFSLDKAAMELLYIPVPVAVKSKAKPVIDTVADRTGTALTGITWLAITIASGADTPGLVVIASTVTLGILASWLFLILRARREYVQAFRVALPGPVVDPHELRVDLRDARQSRAVWQAIRARDERSVILGLDVLDASPLPVPPRDVRPLLDHPAAEVRARALLHLEAAEDTTAVDRAMRALGDEHQVVREAAVRYLARASPEVLFGLATSPDAHVRLAALGCMAKQGPHHARLVADQVRQILSGPLAEDFRLRLEVAHALAWLPVSLTRENLLRLLLDEDTRVARAAGVSAGRLGDVTHVPSLLRALEDKRHRASARAALLGYGTAAIPALEQAMESPSISRTVKQAVPSLLAALGTQAAADVLVKVLPGEDTRIRTRVVRALWRIRRSTEVTLGREAFERAMLHEARTYALHLEALAREGADDVSSGARLLRRALEEKLEDDLERIFRLLGLHYPEREILAAYYGIKNGEASVRASALELLDNLIENPLKSVLLALFEESGTGRATPARTGWRRVPPRSRVETLRALATDPDPWLRSCALFAIGEAQIVELSPEVHAAASDPDPRVREASHLAAGRLQNGATLRPDSNHAHDD
ncbi:MAG: hypothetical protein HY698_11270 [Deltaproteobacteria bacterium]|nr:hypothetical protein [Deltaproteobacteria bacterium]